MDLQRENRDGIELECLRGRPQVLYVHPGGSSVNRNETYFDRKVNQRDDEQKGDASSSKYNEEYMCSNRLNPRNEGIIPSNCYNSVLGKSQNTFARAYSESTCSGYLQKKTNYPPSALGNSNIESQRSRHEYDIKQKYDIQANLTFTNASDPTEELQERAHEKFYSDKTTYCRPVVNFYNQEFLYKTMEKNAKLRRLVTKLIFARQKEKEVENWNNYINNLKKKHNYNYKTKGATSLKYISDDFETPNTIEDIYNTQFTCKPSNPCHSLLQDLYKPYDIAPSFYDDYRTLNEFGPTVREYNPFNTNLLCFPTSSQGRLILLERERLKRLANRGYKPILKNISEEKKLESEGQKIISHKGLGFVSAKSYIVPNNRSTNTIQECASTQTEYQIKPPKSIDVVITKGCNTNQVIYEKGTTTEVCNKETAPDAFHYSDNLKRKSSLVCIEEKLDNLIHSINNFIIEMKTKSAQHKNFDQYNKLDRKNVNHTRSDSYSLARKEKIVCGFIDDNLRTTRNSSEDNFNRIQTIDDNLSKINDILLKEIGKTKLISLKGSSIGETFHPCSVQISVTIPTKEISTEVTRSLSKAVNLDGDNIIIEEIPKREDRRIGIAVNTDPLSLMAMLRVSTEETIRRLLSYVPTIDYYYYLSRLQGPSPKVIEAKYVCNICGAAFTKPSALTDHIQKHELGQTRDCCVCRHVLDLPRRRPSFFKCQYCGQRFTRAYCCELHQEACAKRMGKLHDVTSSLMLLK